METLGQRNGLLSIYVANPAPEVNPNTCSQSCQPARRNIRNVLHARSSSKLRKNSRGAQLSTDGANWGNTSCRRKPGLRASMANSPEYRNSDEIGSFSFSDSDGNRTSQELSYVDRAGNEKERLAYRFKAEATDLLQNSRERLLAVDGREIAGGAMELCAENIKVWWKTTALWYKLPAVVFAPLFLLLRLFCGPAVVWDLSALWILGPFLLGFSVWLVATFYHASKQGVVVTAKTSILLANRGAEFYDYASAGNLEKDIRYLAARTVEQVEGKGKEVLLLTANKKDSLVKYVKSGQLATDAAQQAKLMAKTRAEAFEEWLVRTYEDVIDWWRPTRRAILKLLQKIF